MLVLLFSLAILITVVINFDFFKELFYLLLKNAIKIYYSFNKKYTFDVWLDTPTHDFLTLLEEYKVKVPYVEHMIRNDLENQCLVFFIRKDKENLDKLVICKKTLCDRALIANNDRYNKELEYLIDWYSSLMEEKGTKQEYIGDFIESKE